MVYGELKHFVWYMVNFEETQWYIMKYPLFIFFLKNIKKLIIIIIVVIDIIIIIIINKKFIWSGKIVIFYKNQGQIRNFI